MSHLQSPAPLHLPRLAASAPDIWVALPSPATDIGIGAGTGALRQRVLRLTQKRTGERTYAAGEWLHCLQGEAVIDLPAGQWAHLHAGESLSLGGGAAWDAVPVSGEVVLLRVGVAEEIGERK